MVSNESGSGGSGSDPFDKAYKPVDTDFVDDIEHYALDRIRVEISFVDHKGEAETLNGMIAEVYTKDHAEFLRMHDGRTLRLDQIREAKPHHPHAHNAKEAAAKKG